MPWKPIKSAKPQLPSKQDMIIVGSVAALGLVIVIFFAVTS